jgi:pyruvate/2-oxoglutarate dehydrogenase complex dihydrolipoamide dehydrogenase (E3) component
MPDDHDVVVIGAGPAGQRCADALAGAGLSVAVVERELVGGECDYWACMPSKTLLRPGHAVAEALAAPGAREAVSGRLDAGAAFGWRDFMVSDYSDEAHARALVEKGVSVVRGDGRIAGPGVVEVGGRSLRARHIVVATGSDAAMPPIDGLEGLDGVWTNREATGLSSVPRRFLVLGGGPVGVEMAQAVRRLGASEVVVVEADERVLPGEPPALGDALGEALRADGIELVTGRSASGVRREGDAFALSFEDGSSELRGDRLLVATGRRPRVQGIGLESVGIEPDPKGLLVDARMRTGVEGVWAVGDVTGIWPLTYVGTYQARVAAANILAGDGSGAAPREANYEAVPRVVFTDPQAASVGAADGARSATVRLGETPRATTWLRDYDDVPWFLTLVSDGERVTGAHALGPEAGEWLQQATLAIRARLPLDVLEDTIQPFPTFAEAFRFAVAKLRG